MKANLQGKAFGSNPALFLQALCLKWAASSAVGTYIPPLGGSRPRQQQPLLSGSHLGFPDQQLERQFLLPSTDIFAVEFVALLEL